MKKFILLTIFIIGLVVPGLASAVTVKELQAQIQDLLQQIQTLQNKLLVLQTQSSAKTIESSPTSSLIKENKSDKTVDVSYINKLTKELSATKAGDIAKMPAKDKETKTASLKRIASERKTLMKELIEKDPRLFLSVAIPKSKKSLLAKEIQDDIEKEVTLEGEIEALHIDDFDRPENSKFKYFLKTKEGKINFYPAQTLSLRSETKVRIKGIQLEKTFVADTNKAAFQVLEEAPAPESVGNQRTLVLLIDFLDSGPRPFTKEKAYNLVFNSQFQNFYKEQSYNQVSFSGDVYGWFTLNKNYESGMCGAETQPEFEKIVTDNSINLGNYDRLVFLVSHPLASGGGCSNVGKLGVTVGNTTYRVSKAWVGVSAYFSPIGSDSSQWTVLDFVLSHELGHSLGVVHANGWECGEKVLYGDCSHIEYGNTFDTMGTGSYALHFNAFYKELLGWIKPRESLLINQSGKYTINTLEQAGSTKKFAKIQILNSDRTPFYLEYRRGIGFDAALNNDEFSSNQSGLFINHKIEQEGQFPFPRLLDMTPNPTGIENWMPDIEQATLNGKNTFNDPGRGIAVGPIKQTTSSSIAFEVNLTTPVCAYQKPLIQSNSWYTFDVAAAGTGFASIDFSNEDYLTCGSSEFALTIDGPLSWQYQMYPLEKITLSPGESSWYNVGFTVPEDALPGRYLLRFKITNSRSGLESVKEIVVNVVPKPVISGIEPIIGPAGTDIKISGSGFKTGEGYGNLVIFLNKDRAGLPGVQVNLFSSDGKTLIFSVPNTLLNCWDEINKWYECQTPAGVYDLYLFTNGAYSNTVNFIVNTPPVAEASVKVDKDTYSVSTTISPDAESIYLNVDKDINGDGKASYDPDGEDNLVGGYCQWDMDMRPGETFTPENRTLIGRIPIKDLWNMDNVSSCNIFENPWYYYPKSQSGTYYPTVRITDKYGMVSNLSTVILTVSSATTTPITTATSTTTSTTTTSTTTATTTTATATSTIDQTSTTTTATTTATTTPTLSASAQKLDYNNDGKLDQGDSAMLMDIMMGKCPTGKTCDIISGKITCVTGKICDVNQDGKSATISDIQKFTNIILGTAPVPDFGNSIPLSKVIPFRQQLASILDAVRRVIEQTGLWLRER